MNTIGENVSTYVSNVYAICFGIKVKDFSSSRREQLGEIKNISTYTGCILHDDEYIFENTAHNGRACANDDGMRQIKVKPPLEEGC